MLSNQLSYKIIVTFSPQTHTHRVLIIYNNHVLQHLCEHCTEPLLPEEMQGQMSVSFHLLTTSLSTDQHMTLFSVFVNTQFTLLIQHHNSTPAQNVSNTSVSSIRQAQCSLLERRTTERDFSTEHGGHFKQQNHQEKAEKCEKHGTEETLVYCSSELNWALCLRRLTFQHSVHVCK